MQIPAPITSSSHKGKASQVTSKRRNKTTFLFSVLSSIVTYHHHPMHTSVQAFSTTSSTSTNSLRMKNVQSSSYFYSQILHLNSHPHPTHLHPLHLSSTSTSTLDTDHMYNSDLSQHNTLTDIISATTRAATATAAAGTASNTSTNTRNSVNTSRRKLPKSSSSHIRISKKRNGHHNTATRPTSKGRKRSKKGKRINVDVDAMNVNPIPLLPLTNEQNIINKNNNGGGGSYTDSSSAASSSSSFDQDILILNYPSLPSPRTTTQKAKLRSSQSNTLLKSKRRRRKVSKNLHSTNNSVQQLLTSQEEVSLTNAIKTMKSIIRTHDELSLKLDEFRQSQCESGTSHVEEECDIAGDIYDQQDELSSHHQSRKRQWKVTGYLSSLSKRNRHKIVNDYLSSLESTNDVDLRKGQMTEWMMINEYLSSLSSTGYNQDAQDIVSSMDENDMDGRGGGDVGEEAPYQLTTKPTEEEFAEACDMSISQLRRALVAGREARAKLVSANIGLVTNIAKRYHFELQKSLGGNMGMGSSISSSGNGLVNSNTGMSTNAVYRGRGGGGGGGGSTGTILTLHDFIQEGNLGLMEAAERYDSTKGARFGTYAAYWVRQRILRCIASDSRVIRLPVHVHSMLRTIRKAKDEMEKEIGRTPSMPELAHHLDMPLDKLKLYTESSRTVLSLESQGNAKGGSFMKSGSGEVDKRTLGERIASDIPTPFEDAESDALKQDIRAAIDALGNDRERDVLVIRFGLDDGNPKTLQETAQLLGISRDRVRSIESRALNKLRHPQRNHRLKDYYHDSGDHVSSKTEKSGWEYFNQEQQQQVKMQKQQQQSRRQNERHNVHSPPDRIFHGDTLSKLSPEDIWSF